MIFLVLIAVCQYAALVRAQTISVNITRPTSGVIVHDSLNISATVSSTYQLQGVQASVDGRSTNLFYTTSWTNTISLAGLAWGNKTLIVTATDVFGNSNQAQRSFVFDMPPNLIVTSPMQGTVARPGLQINVSATDDDPAETKIYVWQAIQDVYVGETFVTGSNSISTNLLLTNYDGQLLTLRFEAVDSANQHFGTLRQVYVQSSSNFVEIDRVSDGSIMDVQPDRILFQKNPNISFPPGNETSFDLKVKLRTNGTETVVFTQLYAVSPAYLTAQGAVFVLNGAHPELFTSGAAVDIWQAGTQSELGIHNSGMSLLSKGNFAAWGWGDGGGNNPRLYLTDLQTTNTYLIANKPGFSGISYDLAANGDVVFTSTGSYGGTDKNQGVYRYRNGVTTLLAIDTSNAVNYVKTDGTNVYYIKITSTNQALMAINGSGESKFAETTSIGSDYQINNGWVAYARSGGGQMQIWRRSPAGTQTQLTFYGTSSMLAALAPNGEVAFYNGSRLYISKGTWPPVDIAPATSSSGLTLFWQDDRWCAFLGRSLFQLYTGSPQIASLSTKSNKFCFNLIGANGQHLVTQISTNLIDWTDFATNNISDGGNVEIEDYFDTNCPNKFYRLRLQ